MSEDKVNLQLYENSPLVGSNVEAEYKESSDALFNDKEPNLAIKSEKPEHRQIIFLKAEGYSNRKIAQITGYTEPWVSQVLRQPWARERLVEELRLAGRSQVEAIMAGAVVDSIWKVIDVRDSAMAKPETQLSAANSILDRYLGRATQRVESFNHNENFNITGTLDEVNAELKRLEAEEAKLCKAL